MKILSAMAWCVALMYTCTACRPHIQAGTKPSIKVSVVPRDSIVTALGRNIPVTNIWAVHFHP